MNPQFWAGSRPALAEASPAQNWMLNSTWGPLEPELHRWVANMSLCASHSRMVSQTESVFCDIGTFEVYRQVNFYFLFELWKHNTFTGDLENTERGYIIVPLYITGLFFFLSRSDWLISQTVYLMLLIFLPAILIPACESYSLFCMVHSAQKLDKQGDNIQPWCTPFPIQNQSVHVQFYLLLLDQPTGFLGDR